MQRFVSYTWGPNSDVKYSGIDSNSIEEGTEYYCDDCDSYHTPPDADEWSHSLGDLTDDSIPIDTESSAVVQVGPGRTIYRYPTNVVPRSVVGTKSTGPDFDWRTGQGHLFSAHYTAPVLEAAYASPKGGQLAAILMAHAQRKHPGLTYSPMLSAYSSKIVSKALKRGAISDIKEVNLNQGESEPEIVRQRPPGVWPAHHRVTRQLNNDDVKRVERIHHQLQTAELGGDSRVKELSSEEVAASREHLRNQLYNPSTARQVKVPSHEQLYLPGMAAHPVQLHLPGM